jgi:hypothetical protein
MAVLCLGSAVGGIALAGDLDFSPIIVIIGSRGGHLKPMEMKARRFQPDLVTKC